MNRLREFLFGKPNSNSSSVHPVPQKNLLTLDLTEAIQHKPASNIYTVLEDRFSRKEGSRLIPNNEIVWIYPKRRGGVSSDDHKERCADQKAPRDDRKENCDDQNEQSAKFDPQKKHTHKDKARKAKIKTNPWICLTPSNSSSPTTPHSSVSTPPSVFYSNQATPSVDIGKSGMPREPAGCCVFENRAKSDYSKKTKTDSRVTNHTETIYKIDKSPSDRRSHRDGKQVQKRNLVERIQQTNHNNSLASKPNEEEKRGRTKEPSCKLNVTRNRNFVEGLYSVTDPVRDSPILDLGDYECRVKTADVTNRFKSATSPRIDAEKSKRQLSIIDAGRRRANRNSDERIIESEVAYNSTDFSSEGYSSFGSLYSEKSLADRRVSKLSSEPALSADDKRDVTNGCEEIALYKSRRLVDSGYVAFEESSGSNAGWNDDAIKEKLLRQTSSIKRELTRQKFSNEQSTKLLRKSRKARESDRYDATVGFEDLLTSSDVTFDRGHSKLRSSYGGRFDRSMSRVRTVDLPPVAALRAEQNAHRSRVAARIKCAALPTFPKDVSNLSVASGQSEHESNGGCVDEFSNVIAPVGEYNELGKCGTTATRERGDGCRQLPEVTKQTRKQIVATQNKTFIRDDNNIECNNNNTIKNNVYFGNADDIIKRININNNNSVADKGEDNSDYSRENRLKLNGISSSITRYNQIIKMNNVKRNYFFQTGRLLETAEEKTRRQNLIEKKDFLLLMLKTLTKSLADQKIILQTSYDALLRRQFPNLF